MSQQRSGAISAGHAPVEIEGADLGMVASCTACFHAVLRERRAHRAQALLGGLV